MEQNRKKRRKSLERLAAILISMMMGAGMGLSAIQRVLAIVGNESVLVFEIVLIVSVMGLGVLTWLLMIVAHEAGHLLAGLASGYTFVSFRVASVMLIRMNGRLQWKLFRLAGTAGQCLMKPPAWTEQGVPVRLYNWGGVLMNAAIALLAIPAVCLVPGETLAGVLVRMLLVVNVFMALTNGLPMGNNDGDNALHLVKDLNAQRAFWQQMMIHALSAEGVDIREMPSELFAVPEHADLSNPLIAAIAVNAAEMTMISGDRAATMQRITALLESPDTQLHPIHRFQLQNDLLWLEMMEQNRPEVLDGIRDKGHMQYRKAMSRYPSVVRTVYTEALAKGDAEAAEVQMALMSSIERTYPYPREIELERKLMEMAKVRLGG